MNKSPEQKSRWTVKRFNLLESAVCRIGRIPTELLEKVCDFLVSEDPKGLINQITRTVESVRLPARFGIPAKSSRKGTPIVSEWQKSLMDYLLKPSPRFRVDRRMGTTTLLLCLPIFIWRAQIGNFTYVMRVHNAHIIEYTRKTFIEILIACGIPYTITYTKVGHTLNMVGRYHTVSCSFTTEPLDITLITPHNVFVDDTCITIPYSDGLEVYPPIIALPASLRVKT